MGERSVRVDGLMAQLARLEADLRHAADARAAASAEADRLRAALGAAEARLPEVEAEALRAASARDAAESAAEALRLQVCM